MTPWTDVELEYLAARCEHARTAQECWKLRAALEPLSPEREKELNRAFGKIMESMNADR